MWRPTFDGPTSLAGIPVYGVSGYFADPNIPANTRAHGLDERIGVKAFDQLEFRTAY